jgi:hypothetical protein
MNHRLNRLFVGVLLWLVHDVHAWINAPLPNTRFWALIFFGSAATLEALICLVIPKYLDGKLCDDMLVLGWLCIIVDAAGFAGYMTKNPSIYYNTVMWVISYVQYARLLFVDSDHALSVWNNLVRGAHLLGTKLYHSKAHK